jgi:hypothetical protein
MKTLAMMVRVYAQHMNDLRRAAALQHLVDALDRRLPQLERAEETSIAADAALLRSGAIVRLEAMRNAALEPLAYDRELAEAMMIDDGSGIQ